MNWGQGGQLLNNQGGSIELGDSGSAGVTPYLDFSYGTGGAEDYNVRIINNGDGTIRFETPAGKELSVEVDGKLRSMIKDRTTSPPMLWAVIYNV